MRPSGTQDKDEKSCSKCPICKTCLAIVLFVSSELKTWKVRPQALAVQPVSAEAGRRSGKFCWAPQSGSFLPGKILNCPSTKQITALRFSPVDANCTYFTPLSLESPRDAPSFFSYIIFLGSFVLIFWWLLVLEDADNILKLFKSKFLRVHTGKLICR